ncbi:TPA: hypothetical protein ACGSTL_001224 [Vibrio parahaemolyticus]|uniref:hypothetical protein n=1 Tax=Vibrio campbellii TaxID=680 RepID=UPI001F081873|nr:hypothetical protein [Vibrio campbellii]UMM06643.1 hypothetical protein MKR81_27230 [Vibrio campbellii]
MNDYLGWIVAAIAILALIILGRMYIKLRKKYDELHSGFVSLKEDMKTHTMEHGIDLNLWDMFVEGSRKLIGKTR